MHKARKRNRATGDVVSETDRYFIWIPLHASAYSTAGSRLATGISITLREHRLGDAGLDKGKINSNDS
jgi:hypothetical protein